MGEINLNQSIRESLAEVVSVVQNTANGLQNSFVGANKSIKEATKSAGKFKEIINKIEFRGLDKETSQLDNLQTLMKSIFQNDDRSLSDQLTSYIDNIYGRNKKIFDVFGNTDDLTASLKKSWNDFVLSMQNTQLPIDSIIESSQTNLRKNNPEAMVAKTKLGELFKYGNALKALGVDISDISTEISDVVDKMNSSTNYSTGNGALNFDGYKMFFDVLKEISKIQAEIIFNGEKIDLSRPTKGITYDKELLSLNYQNNTSNTGNSGQDNSADQGPNTTEKAEKERKAIQRLTEEEIKLAAARKEASISVHDDYTAAIWSDETNEVKKYSEALKELKDKQNEALSDAIYWRSQAEGAYDNGDEAAYNRYDEWYNNSLQEYANYGERIKYAQQQFDSAMENFQPSGDNAESWMVTLEILKQIVETLKNLGNISGGVFNIEDVIPSFEKLENHLSIIADNLEKISNSVGVIDQESGAKNLLDSISDISEVLSNVISKFEWFKSNVDNAKSVNSIQKNINYGQLSREYIEIAEKGYNELLDLILNNKNSFTNGELFDLSNLFKSFNQNSSLSKTNYSKSVEQITRLLSMVKKMAIDKGLDISGWVDEYQDKIAEALNKLKANREESAFDIFGNNKVNERLIQTIDILNKITDVLTEIDSKLKNVSDILNNSSAKGTDELSAVFDELRNNINSLLGDLSDSLSYKIPKEITELYNQINNQLLNVKPINDWQQHFISAIQNIATEFKNAFVSKDSLSSRLSEIFKKYSSADLAMRNNGIDLHERGFIYNKDTGEIGNEFVFGHERGMPQDVRYDAGPKNGNIMHHSHPQNFSGMSFVQPSENGSGFNGYLGDILTWYNSYLLGKGDYQINSSINDVSVFNAKAFYDKYGSVIEELRKNKDKASAADQIRKEFVKKAHFPMLFIEDLIQDFQEKDSNVIDDNLANVLSKYFDIDQQYPLHELLPDLLNASKKYENQGSAQDLNNDLFNIIDDFMYQNGSSYNGSDIQKNFYKEIFTAFTNKNLDQLFDGRGLFDYNFNKLLPDLFKEALGIDDFSDFIKTVKLEDFGKENIFGIFGDEEQKSVFDQIFDTQKISEFNSILDNIVGKFKELGQFSLEKLLSIDNINTEDIKKLLDGLSDIKSKEQKLPVEQPIQQTADKTADSVKSEGEAAEEAEKKIDKLNQVKIENAKVNINMSSTADSTAEKVLEEGKAAGKAAEEIEKLNNAVDKNSNISPNSSEWKKFAEYAKTIPGIGDITSITKTIGTYNSKNSKKAKSEKEQRISYRVNDDKGNSYTFDPKGKLIGQKNARDIAGTYDDYDKALKSYYDILIKRLQDEDNLVLKAQELTAEQDVKDKFQAIKNLDEIGLGDEKRKEQSSRLASAYYGEYDKAVNAKKSKDYIEQLKKEEDEKEAIREKSIAEGKKQIQEEQKNQKLADQIGSKREQAEEKRKSAEKKEEERLAKSHNEALLEKYKQEQKEKENQSFWDTDWGKEILNNEALIAQKRAEGQAQEAEIIAENKRRQDDFNAAMKDGEETLKAIERRQSELEKTFGEENVRKFNKQQEQKEQYNEEYNRVQQDNSQHRVIGTTKGNKRESFTYSDYVGEKTTISRSLQKDGSWKEESKTVVKYTDIVKQAANALVELRQAQHDLDEESKKNAPDQGLLSSYQKKIDIATDKYTEANARMGHYINNPEQFINDSSKGSRITQQQYTDDVLAATNEKFVQQDIKFRQEQIIADQKACLEREEIVKKSYDREYQYQVEINRLMIENEKNKNNAILVSKNNAIINSLSSLVSQEQTFRGSDINAEKEQRKSDQSYRFNEDFNATRNAFDKAELSKRLKEETQNVYDALDRLKKANKQYIEERAKFLKKNIDQNADFDSTDLGKQLAADKHNASQDVFDAKKGRKDFISQNKSNLSASEISAGDKKITEEFVQTSKDLSEARLKSNNDLRLAFEKRKQILTQGINQIGKQPKKKYADNFAVQIQNFVDDFNKANIDFINPQNIEASEKQLVEFENRLEAIKVEAKQGINILADPSKLEQVGDKIAEIRLKASAMNSEQFTLYNELRSSFEKFRETGQATEQDIANLDALVRKVINDIKNSGNWKDNFFVGLGKQLKSKNMQLVAQYLSLQDWIRYIRAGVETVTQLDSAFTELRKVSDATNTRLQQSMRTSSEVAKDLGSTISDVVNITAD